MNKLVYRIGEPRRGDIVMLYYPLNPDKSFVKRVIAEEGDTVRIVDGRVYVNDIPLHDDYVPGEFRSHDDWGPQVIPEGYYFVMGDHRNNSSDSRHWGMVPKKLHHRQSAAALVARAGGARVLDRGLGHGRMVSLNFTRALRGGRPRALPRPLAQPRRWRSRRSRSAMRAARSASCPTVFTR